MNRRIRAAASGLVVVGLCGLPFAASANEMIESVMKKHRAAVAELKSAIAASRDANSAKANAPKIEAAAKAESDAENELAALMPKLDPKKDAAAYEKAVTEVQKANQEITDMKLKVMATKDAGPELNKALK